VFLSCQINAKLTSYAKAHRIITKMMKNREIKRTKSKKKPQFLITLRCTKTETTDAQSFSNSFERGTWGCKKL